MSFQQRRQLRILFSAAALALCLISLLMRLKISPVAEELIKTHVDNQASDTINAALSEQIAEGEISYDSMVNIQKDYLGRVTAAQINMEEVNRLKTAVLSRVDEKLEQMSTEELSIPCGSVVLPQLFSGMGPPVPVRVLAVRSSDAEFHSSFTHAGINQTLHSITVDIQVVITVLSWSGTFDVPVRSSVLAAQTVIVGTVPTTYFGMEEGYGSETGNHSADTASGRSEP